MVFFISEIRAWCTMYMVNGHIVESVYCNYRPGDNADFFLGRFCMVVVWLDGWLCN